MFISDFAVPLFYCIRANVYTAVLLGKYNDDDDDDDATYSADHCATPPSGM